MPNPWDTLLFSPVYFPIDEDDPINIFQIGLEDQFTYELGSPDLLILNGGFSIASDDFGNEDNYGAIDTGQ